MAVEIKRWDGHVLYVAENAGDVRQALTEAVASDAVLSGADLSGVDLRNADLREADLSGADLRDADLRGADLRGADGLDWAGVADILNNARQTINDGGKHWIQGSISRALPDGSTAYCAVGAVQKQPDGVGRSLALWLLSCVAAGPIEAFNDHEGTTWEDVDRVFLVAIRHAERFAALPGGSSNG